MVYTITLNPAIDYAVSVENYEIGRVNRTYAENITAGGKGINVSVILKRLGAETTALGFCGGFTGNMLLEMLNDMEVDNDFIYIPDGFTRINVKLKADSTETEINGRGFNIDETSLECLYNKLDELQSGDFLVLAGSVPKSLPPDIYVKIAERLNEKDVEIVIDASGDVLMQSLKLRPFLIKPNNFELGEIFGKNIDSREKAVEYAKKLRDMGAWNVLVSLAGEGAILVCENGEVYSSPAPTGTVRNSVGAGDSMVAGFIYGYLSSYSFETAFKYGIASGSATAFSDFLAQKSEIESVLELL